MPPPKQSGDERGSTNNWCDAVTDCHRDWFFNPILMIFGAASNKLGSKPFIFRLKLNGYDFLYFVDLSSNISFHSHCVCICVCPTIRLGSAKDARLMDPLSFPSHWEEIQDHLIIKSHTLKLVSEEGNARFCFGRTIHIKSSPISQKNAIMSQPKINRGPICFFSRDICVIVVQYDLWSKGETKYLNWEKASELFFISLGSGMFGTIFNLYMCMRVFVYIYLYLCVSCTPCMFGRLCALLAGTWGG